MATGTTMYPGELKPMGIGNDGQFMLFIRIGVPTKLAVDGLPPSCYVKEILYKGVRLQGGILMIDTYAMSHEVRIVVSDRAAMVRGTLLRDGEVPPDGQGVILPWPLQIEDGFPSFQSFRPVVKGRFQVGGLPPGFYRLIGFDESMTSERFNTPGVLARLAVDAEEVNLQEGRNRTLALTGHGS